MAVVIRVNHSSHARADPSLPDIDINNAQIPYAYRQYPYYTPASIPVPISITGSETESSEHKTKGPAPPSPSHLGSTHDHVYLNPSVNGRPQTRGAGTSGSGNGSGGAHTTNGHGNTSHNHAHSNGSGSLPPPPIPSAHGTLVDGGAARRPAVRLLQAMNLLDRLGVTVTAHTKHTCNIGCQNGKSTTGHYGGGVVCDASHESNGLLVEAIELGGVCESAGVQIEDVITRVNERPVWSVEQFLLALKKALPLVRASSEGERRVVLEVKRGLQTRYFQIDVQKFLRGADSQY